MSLVLAGDADEHEQWHDRLDDLLTEPAPAARDVPIADWPVEEPGDDVTRHEPGGL